MIMLNLETRESKFKLCLYNAAKVLKKKSFCVYSVKYPKLAKNLYAMLEAFPGQPDTEKQNCWEIALLLVALYKYLIHIRKSRLERSRSLYTYLFEFQSGLKDRIWLFPYRGGWTFSLLAAHMLQRDVDSIPSARELISSKYFLRWMIERDLFQCYVRYRAEHDFAALSKEEFQEFQQISMMVNTGYMLEEAIVLQSNWREIKNNLTNAEKVIAVRFFLSHFPQLITNRLQDVYALPEESPIHKRPSQKQETYSTDLLSPRCRWGLL